MKKPHIIHQIWPFTCLTCRHAWESAYEAWHADDGRGGQVITWRHKGTPSTPPWIEPACPACAGFQVKTLPPGTRTSPGERPPPTAKRTAGQETGEKKRPAEGEERPAGGGEHPAVPPPRRPAG